MPDKDEEIGFPTGNADERELLLSWLGYLRGSIVRKLHGVNEAGARWQPDDRLISLLGIVNHLTHVEWRWIDGTLRGAETSRSEAEFHPTPELTVGAAIAAYRERAAATDAAIHAASTLAEPARRRPDLDLRWIVLHLINETARHAGHADATRELLDGVTGE
ncbi:MAG: DUF664 domain-containing protein [Candidatus Dormibacteraceae bacterium]